LNIDIYQSIGLGFLSSKEIKTLFLQSNLINEFYCILIEESINELVNNQNYTNEKI